MARPQVQTDPPGVPARRAALRTLDAVLRRGSPLEAALAGAGQGLPPSDRALAHALASAVLRRTPDLDALIDSATRQRLPDDAKARAVLRIALAQALVLGTPPHAAISTVLLLVDGGPRKLVHGVFGTLMRGDARLPEPPNLPGPVAARWLANWGEEAVEAARRAIAEPPPLDLALRDAGSTAEWAERLGGESFLPGHVRLPARASVAELPGYSEGAWWVQDVAAGLPARAIGPGAGRALDLCAAPGGKALQLAAAGWDVTALDKSESRLARLRGNFARTGLSAQVVQADALAWEPDGAFDAVLLDAPCSATGIFRRHPDALHRAHPGFLADMADLQARMLARGADWVRPGGVLVYATCSLEPEEGERQAERFLSERGDFALALPSRLREGLGEGRSSDAALADPPSPDPSRVAEGEWMRVLPSTFPKGSDGFFIARFTRNG